MGVHQRIYHSPCIMLPAAVYAIHTHCSSTSRACERKPRIARITCQTRCLRRYKAPLDAAAAADHSRIAQCVLMRLCCRYMSTILHIYEGVCALSLDDDVVRVSPSFYMCLLCACNARVCACVMYSNYEQERRPYRRPAR